MCIKRVEVSGLDTEQSAHEVKQYLLGIPDVNNVVADSVNSVVVVDYDEDSLSYDDVLTELEYAGCRPADRRRSILGAITNRLR